MDLIYKIFNVYMKIINILRNYVNPCIFWEWTDMAFCFRIYKLTNLSEYHVGVDIQIIWLNIWIQCLKKNR